MLGISQEVYKGILFLRMQGEFTKKSYPIFQNRLQFLLDYQGLHYFVLNFERVKQFDQMGLLGLENQLDEILSCGKVAICGLDENKKKFLMDQENLCFVQNEWDACNYLYL